MRLDSHILDDAGTLGPPELRSSDAIHLACARLLGVELRALVTYDARMAGAARSLAISVATPA